MIFFPESKWSSTQCCRFLLEIGAAFTVYASFVEWRAQVPQTVTMNNVNYLLNCWHVVCVRKNVSFYCTSFSCQMVSEFIISLFIDLINSHFQTEYSLFPSLAVHLHCTKETIAEDFRDENNSFCGKQCLMVFTACC